jgi:hypothetical protein
MCVHVGAHPQSLKQGSHDVNVYYTSVVDEHIFNRWWVDSSRAEAPAVAYLRHAHVRAPQNHSTDVDVAKQDL